MPGRLLYLCSLLQEAHHLARQGQVKGDERLATYPRFLLLLNAPLVMLGFGMHGHSGPQMPVGMHGLWMLYLGQLDTAGVALGMNLHNHSID